MSQILAVYQIEWHEVEPYWGTNLDEVSYHKTIELAKAYKTRVTSKHWRPSEPKLVEVKQDVYDKVLKEGSVRYDKYDKEIR